MLPDRWLLAVVALLTVGTILGRNPASCAAAIMILLSYVIAAKYFHASFYDESRKELTELKAALEKIKAKQSTQDLRTAFGGKNG